MKAVAVLTGALAVCLVTACGSVAEPIPQGKAGSVPEASAEVSMCDQVREAFLTGTRKQQTAALRALQKDRTADATAREYAKYWLNRDKGDPEQREMDESLIVMSCEL